MVAAPALARLGGASAPPPSLARPPVPRWGHGALPLRVASAGAAAAAVAAAAVAAAANGAAQLAALLCCGSWREPLLSRPAAERLERHRFGGAVPSLPELECSGTFRAFRRRAAPVSYTHLTLPTKA